MSRARHYCHPLIKAMDAHPDSWEPVSAAFGIEREAGPFVSMVRRGKMDINDVRREVVMTLVQERLLITKIRQNPTIIPQIAQRRREVFQEICKRLDSGGESEV